MAGPDRKPPMSEDEELMRLALEQEQQGTPTAGRAARSAAAEAALREEMFVEAYLRTGNETQAAKAAGYKKPAQVGLEMLGTPRIREAITKEAAVRVDAAKLSRAYIIEKHIEIIEGPNVFARIKSLEQLSKMMGYFAPIKHQTIAGQEGNPYAQLVETLRAQGASFTEEERIQLRVQLIQDLAAVQEALALLGGGEKVS